MYIEFAQYKIELLLLLYYIILHQSGKVTSTTMIILRKPQIAELIEAGCAFKSNVIISKNTEYCSLEAGFSRKERETKTKKERNKKTITIK